MFLVLKVLFQVIEHLQVLVYALGFLRDAVHYLEGVSPDLFSLLTFYVAGLTGGFF